MFVPAEKSHLPLVAALAAELWPKHTKEELAQEFASVLGSETAAVFLALEDGAAAAFSQCSLRHDYVEGTQSNPVGYLEGIYVTPGCRGKGLARGLLAQCEAWAAAADAASLPATASWETPPALPFT